MAYMMIQLLGALKGWMERCISEVFCLSTGSPSSSDLCSSSLYMVLLLRLAFLQFLRGEQQVWLSFLMLFSTSSFLTLGDPAFQSSSKQIRDSGILSSRLRPYSLFSEGLYSNSYSFTSFGRVCQVSFTQGYLYLAAVEKDLYMMYPIRPRKTPKWSVPQVMTTAGCFPNRITSTTTRNINLAKRRGLVLLSDFFLLLQATNKIAPWLKLSRTRHTTKEREKKGVNTQKARDVKRNILYLSSPSDCLKKKTERATIAANPRSCEAAKREDESWELMKRLMKELMAAKERLIEQTQMRVF